jgi:hypothetical protein
MHVIETSWRRIQELDELIEKARGEKQGLIRQILIGMGSRPRFKLSTGRFLVRKVTKVDDQYVPGYQAETLVERSR